MRPWPWARMRGRTAFVMRTRPKKLRLKRLWAWATEFLDGAGRAETGVVDEDVDPSEPFDHFLDGGGDGFVTGHVEIEEGHTGGRSESRGVPSGSDHLEPGRDEGASGCATDPRRRPRLRSATG